MIYFDRGDNMPGYMLENKHYKTLNALTLGYEKCKSLHTFGYTYTDFYLIHYVFSGCGTLYKNKTPISVSAGEMFIIKPSNVYTYTADCDNPWEYMWFSFGGELASFFETVDDVHGLVGHKTVNLYYGSSTYTVDEMRVLIDWLLDQCSQMELPIPLSKKEEEELLERWGKR